MVFAFLIKKQAGYCKSFFVIPELGYDTTIKKFFPVCILAPGRYPFWKGRRLLLRMKNGKPIYIPV